MKCALYVGYHHVVACLFRATANEVERYPRLRYERDTNCHAYSGCFVTAFDLTYCSVLYWERQSWPMSASFSIWTRPQVAQTIYPSAQ